LNHLTNYLETLLEAMTKPQGYEGPSVEIVLKDQKAEKEQTKATVDDLLKSHVSGTKIAIFQKHEKTDGPLSECVLETMSANKYEV
jgi:hypothetical protein